MLTSILTRDPFLDVPVAQLVGQTAGGSLIPR